MNNAFVRQDKTRQQFYLYHTPKKETLKKDYFCKVQATWKMAKKLI